MVDWPLRSEDSETFKALDPATRTLILRMLDQPTEADHQEMDRHPNEAMLSSWLLELPAYKNAPDWDDDDYEQGI